MNAYLNYMAEANLGILLFLIIYQAMLRNDTNFAFRRTYLLIALIASLLFPILQININETALTTAVQAELLPHMIIEAGKGTSSDGNNTINVWNLIAYIYLTVVGLLLFRFTFQSAKLWHLLQRSSAFLFDGKYKIHITNEPAPSFSFFRFIVIGNALTLDEREKEQIIRHEVAHASYLHSVDVLLAELVSILFWFNPAIWVYKKIISDVHEFQADEKTVEDRDAQAYCSLLARISLQSAGFTIANHFNKSLTLKRIAMIKSIKKRTATWKFVSVLFVIPTFFAFSACQDKLLKDIEEVTESPALPLELPAEVQEQLNAPKKEHPDAKFIVSEVSIGDFDSQMDELYKKTGGKENVTGSHFVSAGVSDSNERRFVILKFGDGSQSVTKAHLPDGDVFIQVEKSAQPKEGMKEFYSMIQANLKYPEAARTAGLSGKVFAEFIVEKDGSLSSFNILKGMGNGCDEEVLRVLSLSVPWEPARQSGEPVRQKMVLPFVFNLGNGI